MLCDALEGWNGRGGKEGQDGEDVCILIGDSHGCTATHCKAIIFQLKINFKNNNLKKKCAVGLK